MRATSSSLNSRTPLSAHIPCSLIRVYHSLAVLHKPASAPPASIRLFARRRIHTQSKQQHFLSFPFAVAYRNLQEEEITWLPASITKGCSSHPARTSNSLTRQNKTLQGTPPRMKVRRTTAPLRSRSHPSTSSSSSLLSAAPRRSPRRTATAAMRLSSATLLLPTLLLLASAPQSANALSCSLSHVDCETVEW
mgnify:CR=1 FL=1